MRVRHVRLAGQERLLPEHRAVAQDPAGCRARRRQLAEQQLGPERRVAQLGMGEPEVIVALGDVVARIRCRAQKPSRSGVPSAPIR